MQDTKRCNYLYETVNIKYATKLYICIKVILEYGNNIIFSVGEGAELLDPHKTYFSIFYQGEHGRIP
jgi:hypothetical protein